MKKSDRQIIFDKYGGRCAYCGCGLDKGWHVDHMLPIRRKRKAVGGFWDNQLSPDRNWVERKYVPDGCEHPERDVLENKIASCRSCNINKHGQSVEEFRSMIAGFMKSLNERIVQYKVARRYGLIQETGIEVKFYFETSLINKQEEK